MPFAKDSSAGSKRAHCLVFGPANSFIFTAELLAIPLLTAVLLPCSSHLREIGIEFLKKQQPSLPKIQHRYPSRNQYQSVPIKDISGNNNDRHNSHIVRMHFQHLRAAGPAENERGGSHSGKHHFFSKAVGRHNRHPATHVRQHPSWLRQGQECSAQPPKMFTRTQAG